MSREHAVTGDSTPFAVGTFESADGDIFGGLVVGDRVKPLGDIPATPPTVRGLLEDWAAALPGLQAAAVGFSQSDPGGAYRLDELRPLPPVRPSGVVLCAGANYRQHVEELTRSPASHDGSTGPDQVGSLDALDARAREGEPYLWVASAAALSGAQDDIVLPERGTRHDWELELAVVIGRRARHVPPEQALDVVAGYTISNDITTRDGVMRPDIPGIGTDWFRSKCAPSFFPTGPYLVPAVHAGDPEDLEIQLLLNGEPMQRAKTSGMVFGIRSLIAYASSVSELWPGDMILTGSPPGNGVTHGRFLQPGDVIEGTITGLGTQRNRCVAEVAYAGTPSRRLEDATGKRPGDQ